MANWFQVDDGTFLAEVFSGACPAAFATLDLKTNTAAESTGIPVGQRVLAYLRVTPGAGAQDYGFGPDDDADDYFSTAASAGHGGSMVYLDSALAEVGLVRIPTDLNGEVKWRGTAAVACKVDLVGWSDIPFDGGGLPSGVVPIAFTDLDTGLGVRGYVLIKALEVANSEAYSTRPDGDVGDYHTAGGGVGACTSGDPQAATAETYSLVCSAAGIIEERSDTGALNVTKTLLMQAKEGQESTYLGSTIFPSAFPPIAWQDLDTGIGFQTAVRLRVHREPIVGAGFYTNLAFRTKGDTGNYLASVGRPGGAANGALDADEVMIVEVVTDPDGFIEWNTDSPARSIDIDLLDVFNDGPQFSLESPTPLATIDSDITVAITSMAGTDTTTLNLDLTDPLAAVFNVIIGGVFQAGYTGTIATDATTGVVTVTVETAPIMMPGLWTVDVDVDDLIGENNAFSWTFTVVVMAITLIEQVTLNAIEVTFDQEPRHLDPVDPRDTYYLDAYTITGPVGLPQRLLQAVTWEGSNVVRLWMDGELHEGWQYSISVSGIKTAGNIGLWPEPTAGTLIAFGADKPPIPELLDPSARYDLHNPQVGKDSHGGGLGVLHVDEEGDLDVETHRPYLRKRIMRRLTSEPGGFAHLTDYGLLIGSKTLIKPADLRRLQQDAESQILREPDVQSVRASVSQPLPGLIRLRLKVRDTLGEFEVDATLGEEA